MKKVILSILTLFLASSVMATEPIIIDLYPDGPAESNGLSGEEGVSENGLVTNISHARMMVYLPEGAKDAMMVMSCPGGGYRGLSSINEGTSGAEYFNSQGIAFAVLMYRLPNGHCNVPLTDAFRGIEIIRENAQEWGVDPHNVGIIGFSAGGHLASTAVTKYKTAMQRPDFGVLVYPVITMNSYTHKYSRERLMGTDVTDEQMFEWSSELNVQSDTPPVFVSASADDKVVDPRNSIRFYNALLDKGIDGCEMHIFPNGVHGWGYNHEFPARETFDSALMSWLKERK